MIGQRNSVSSSAQAWLVLLVLAAASLSGCTAHYPVNSQIEEVVIDVADIYAGRNPRLGGADRDILVVVSFSGGGTRAAAFSYGVLEELADTRILVNGRETRFLDEVDAITSVSGGSVTAAYFGLFGDRIFEDFEQKFLTKNVQGMLTRGLITPTAWLKPGSPYYGRSEQAADLYDELLFENKTYRDLLEAGGPAIMVNATDMALGSQFTFFTPQFNFLCSDLLDFPVSRAVTASSAVPLLFNSVVLRNYSGSCNQKIPPWVHDVLAERDLTSRQFHLARMYTLTWSTRTGQIS